MVDFRESGQAWTSLRRFVATLTAFAVVSCAVSCRKDAEPSRADAVGTPPAAAELPTNGEPVGFSATAGDGGTRARARPARSPVSEAQGASQAPPERETSRPPSIDSDAYVTLDPDAETKARESADDSSRLETGLSADSTGQAALDSDAYALTRE